ncbi:MAG TPA: 4-(cytidine 5'-diphospho)-2-C-methyl-D-erythritol kinase, partial [Pirellulaceae bacterium]|nr:4-(cytidine 5'-diphospho)-2-C-methyl-D-erythritol kinase [Pirellulaceae bacterium]
SDSLHIAARDDGQIDFTSRWATVTPSSASELLGDVPTGSSNIVVRAIEKLRDRAGVSQGATVRLTKRIPSAAGLGGASSDAAAALLGANAAWELGWSREQLAAIAAEIGSDIPFFFGPPAAICRGRGEQIEPLEPLAPLDIVLVRPPVGLSTPQVYQRCKPATEPADLEPLVQAWRAGDLAGVANSMMNRLQAPASELSPWIDRLKQAFDEQGCLGHQMSGSGSSYFGICRHAEHARQIAQRLAARELGFVVCTRTLTRHDNESRLHSELVDAAS